MAETKETSIVKYNHKKIIPNETTAQDLYKDADAAAKYWYILKTANIRHYKIRGQKQTTSQITAEGHSRGCRAIARARWLLSIYTALLKSGVEIAPFMVTAMLMYATRHIESTGQTHPMSTDKVTLPLKIPDVPFVWDSEVELSLFEEVPRLDGISQAAAPRFGGSTNVLSVYGMVLPQG
ncbi:hypothetical protein AFLA_014069 [Aspergillus flavus NRRL3357]|nr:hypothetical protein AFLA_014069 [Aspergillus flavus NRRL3357]